MRMNLQNIPQSLKPFYWMGLDLEPGDEQYNGTCPFCDKERHFYVSRDDGLWDCKSCGLSGNILGFYRQCFEESLAKPRKKESYKGIPSDVLKEFKCVRSFLTNEWIIPYLSAKDAELLTFGMHIEEFKDGLKYPPGLEHCLFNLNTLGKDPSRPIFLCEGPTDAMALCHHLQMEKCRRKYDVLAVPSAGTFKEKWAKFFVGRDVRILFDNDQAGVSGAERLRDILRGCMSPPKHLSILEWPEGIRANFDIRDLVQEGDPTEEEEIVEIVDE